MENIKPTEYAFPCSIIRANEKKILSKVNMTKIIEAKTVQQAMNILNEFGYGDGKELENQRDFDRDLKSALKEAYELVLSVAPSKEELELFLYPNDYHNVKVIIKSESLNMDPSHLLLDTGHIEKEKMLEMMRERNFIFMSVTMKEGINEALDVFAKGHDPQEIDIILDKACYKDMYEKALQIGNEFIMNYVKLCIDIMNVTTFVRLREIKKPWSFYQKIFLPGGSISEKILVTSWEEAYNQVAEKLTPFGFKNLLVDGTNQVTVDGKYTTFEKIADDMRLKFVKDAKFVSFGVEPLVGYLIAKEMETKNLRIALTGKISDVPVEKIQERLRDTYV